MVTWIRGVNGRDRYHKQALYRCFCGFEFVAQVHNVNTGHTRSCGCLRSLATGERFTKHGHKADGKRTPTYVTWVNMKSRCNNPKATQYEDYGGRGIKVCERWNSSFENFLADMGEKPPRWTIDRINNEIGYEPGNCQWASLSVQGLNKRNVVRYEFNGQHLTLGQWAKVTGIGRITLFKRIKAGIPIEQALTVKGFLGYRRTERKNIDQGRKADPADPGKAR